MSVTSSRLQRAARRGGQVTGVGFDIRGFEEARRAPSLLLDRMPWFQERAIQSLYRALPVEARRDIQAEYNIRAGRVREHLAVRYLDGDGARLGGVRLYGQWKRGIGMMQYPGTRQTRRGVSYSVYHGVRKVEEGAFIARLLAGHRLSENEHVAVRYGPRVEMKAGRYKGKKRQRIATVYRSTVAQMLARGRRPERLAEWATRYVGGEVKRQVASYMGSTRRSKR